MPDRLIRLLRGVTWVLLGALVLRLALALFRPSPLADLRIPALPTLSAASSSSNTPPTAPTAAPPSIPGPAGTSNVVALPPGTNTTTTNAAGPAPASVTNSPPKASGTQAVASASSPSNTPPTRPAARPAVAGGSFPGMPPGFPFPGGPGPRGPGAMGKPLDPVLQARLDKVIQGELLGPAPRPIPMALLGIAGTNAFIRTTSGMSGMVGEGGELGGVRLVRIGINRVLVDEGGTNKELTIFGGAGGESLLPKSTNQP